jgi:hypothetical protein
MTLVVIPLVVVFAVVMMFAVVMARRVVGAVLGDGGSRAPNSQGEGDSERRGYARYEFHFCLLNGRVPVVT